MTDILDTLDELDDELDFDDDDFESSVEIVASSEAGIIDEDYELNEDEARNITDAIRSAATATYVLLAQAHAHKAHKALGYETWSDYVESEFDMSSQRSYQLLDLNKVISTIEAATPEGTSVRLTEAQARDIKRELPRITEQIEEETEGKSAEDAEGAVDRVIDEIREQKKLENKEEERRQKELDDQEEEDRQKSLETAADALLEADRPDGVTDVADDGLLEVDIDGDGDNEISRESSMHIYNFFNTLDVILALPEPDAFIAIVPDDRKAEVDEKLLEVAGWLNRFQTLWELKDD